MSRRALETQLVDSKRQLAEAQRELELSTFLNKGVLQSNSEFKLRIAELQQENTVLRAAESRLALTEDKAELAERRAKEAQEEVGKRESYWQGVSREQIAVRQELEVELEMLREEVRAWREVGDVIGDVGERVRGVSERVGGLMKRHSEGGDRNVRRGMSGSVNALAGPSRLPKSQRTTSVLLSSTLRTAYKPQSSANRPSEASPIIMIPTSRGQKRRRRIEDSADRTDDNLGDNYSPPSPAPDRTPTRQTRSNGTTTTAPRTTRANSTSSKKREVVQPTRRPEAIQPRRRSSPARAVGDIKLEDESEESENDPLDKLWRQ